SRNGAAGGGRGSTGRRPVSACSRKASPVRHEQRSPSAGPAPIPGPAAGDRVVVVGAGWHFSSGISHYTYRLSAALAEELPVGALLMRRLVPRRLYPGREHVGASSGGVAYPPHVPVYDGVDWYWGPSLSGALRYLDQQRPAVLILQWWTGAVL